MHWVNKCSMKRKQKVPTKVMGKSMKVRHILLKLNPLLNDAQAKAELERIRSEIISGKMTFADAALKYSKDYLSGANGGSLNMPSQKLMWAHLQKWLKQLLKVPFQHHLNLNLVGISLEVTGSRDGDKTEDAYRQNTSKS